MALPVWSLARLETEAEVVRFGRGKSSMLLLGIWIQLKRSSPGSTDKVIAHYEKVVQIHFHGANNFVEHAGLVEAQERQIGWSIDPLKPKDCRHLSVIDARCSHHRKAMAAKV